MSMMDTDGPENKIWTVMIIGLVALFFIALGLTFANAADDSGEPDTSDMVQRSMISDGQAFQPFRLQIGSEVATNLFFGVFEGTGTRSHRVTTVVNTDSSYQLMLSSWSRFKDTDAYLPVATGSGTAIIRSHQPVFARYPSGKISSGTVRGSIESSGVKGEQD